MNDKVIVITGASSGIGAALAKKLGARGAHLVLAARREKELAEIAAASGGPENTLAVVADVTRRADVDRIRDEAVARFGRVDAWINNAGRGIARNVEDLSDEDVDEMVAVNVKSALYGMQAALADMKPRGKGHIVNVSSMLGRVPLVPMRSAYSASKHMLNALTANLRMDLRASHPDIHVSLVMPGPVSTGFAASSRGVDGRPAYAGPNPQTADEVADAIIEVLEHPRAEIFTAPGNDAMSARYYQDVAKAEVEILEMLRAVRPGAPKA